MKNKIKNSLRWIACIMIVGWISACSDKNSSGNARVEVRLTDAPADYQEVNIDIQDLQIHSEGGDPNDGWQSLPVRKGVYNLLTLTNGLDTLLGTTTLPAGKIAQLRLVLGSTNSIRLNNVTAPLSTPSAQQSGLKVQLNTELKDGITYKILLDFDAARSIVATGSGKYILKPVIRAVASTQNGAIKGTVSPATALPVVYAITGVDTVSTYANTSGQFLAGSLAPATYRLVLVSKAGATIEKSGIVVTTGNVTDAGTITFP